MVAQQKRLELCTWNWTLDSDLDLDLDCDNIKLPSTLINICFVRNFCRECEVPRPVYRGVWHCLGNPDTSYSNYIFGTFCHLFCTHDEKPKVYGHTVEYVSMFCNKDIEWQIFGFGTVSSTREKASKTKVNGIFHLANRKFH